MSYLRKKIKNGLAKSQIKSREIQPDRQKKAESQSPMGSFAWRKKDEGLRQVY